MKTIGFVGAYDKMDFILYIAKCLTMLGQKVLVVDNTTTQKARYIVPTINPTKSYITEFEKIDVAIGFNNFEEIRKYLGSQSELEYNVALIDADSKEVFEQFEIKKCDRKYFVTSFDLCYLKKGIEILNQISEPIQMTKVIYAKDILKEDDEYLNFLTLGTKVIWNEEYRIYLPIDNGDQNIIIENQRVAKISIRKLSSQYRESLLYVVEDILSQDMPAQEVRRMFKIIEKEV